MSEVIDFLMKTKNADGTFSTLHPITKTNNVKTSEEIEVMLKSSVGSFKNGDVIEAGTSVDSIVRKLVQVQIPPTYTAPTVGITVSSGTAAGTYEVGTKASPAFSATFTKNDAGALTNIIISKNGAQVATSTTSPVTHSETDMVIDGTITFNATATYGAGAIKQDNFGADYETGKITAGSKVSSDITYTGFRKYFYGVDNKTVAATTSTDIRGLTNSTAAATAGTTFTVSVTKGQTRATFAYPATLRDVNSVKYVEFNNDESKTFFNKTTVAVEGANGHTAIDYKVYTYIPAQPFPSNMTFKVTI